MQPKPQINKSLASEKVEIKGKYNIIVFQTKTKIREDIEDSERASEIAKEIVDEQQRNKNSD